MTTIQRPQRWDEPFDLNMTDADVDRILSIPPFNRMDPKEFPALAPLRDILRNDTRILHYQNGDVVVREGDYGNSAFFILSGAVRVEIEPAENPLPTTVLGRRECQRKGFFQALAQLWRNPKEIEVRDSSLYSTDSQVGTRHDDRGSVRIFLQDVPAVLDRYKTERMEAGEFFGEIAALGRTPRTATIFTEGEAELLEIRWQGLRDLRRGAGELRAHIDNLYRERSLKRHLLETPMFQHLAHPHAPDECACGRCRAMTEIIQNTQFETYGHFDWYASYKTLVEESAADRLAREPVIVEEGSYPSGLILIRAGFARVSQRFGHGHRTLSYLGRGKTYGFDVIVHNWRNKTQVPLQHTLRAIGYVDVLIVPTSMIEKYVLEPDWESLGIPQDLLPPLPLPRALPEGTSIAQPARNIGVKIREDRRDAYHTKILEFLVENRFINGTATMVINLDRCTRCDDCVRACAATHDNNPRFVRQGLRLGNYMVANACQHCADPVCMIGCPTGAIHRDSFQGQVVINDVTCIGCSICANSCPYDNIRMVEIRDKHSNFILDQKTHVPILKATKCDLCIDQISSPACQRACPHDALIRVDLHNDPESLANWMNR
jgi:Fe-S-cluster-containing dehydrogenase component/CRP-like cAMP-binding protein